MAWFALLLPQLWLQAQALPPEMRLVLDAFDGAGCDLSCGHGFMTVGSGGVFYLLRQACLFAAPVAGGGGPATAMAVEQTLTCNGGVSYDPASADLFIANHNFHSVYQIDPHALQVLPVEYQPENTEYNPVDYFSTPMPSGVAVLGSFLYVVEERHNRVVRYDTASPTTDSQIVLGCKTLTTFCAPGQDTDLLLDPTDIVASPVGPQHELFVADTGNHRVVRVVVVSSSGNPAHSYSDIVVETSIVAGLTGVPGCMPEQLRDPLGLAIDSDGYLYVADSGNHRVQKFAPYAGDRMGVTVAGDCCCFPSLPDGSPAGGSGAYLTHPAALAWDSETRELLIYDQGNDRVTAVGGDTGSDAPRIPGAPGCAYGAECVVRVAGALPRPVASNLVVIVRLDEEGGTNDTCGSPNCSIAAWPGISNPAGFSGSFLNSLAFGVAEGPADNHSLGTGEYVLCLGHAPSSNDTCEEFPTELGPFFMYGVVIEDPPRSEPGCSTFYPLAVCENLLGRHPDASERNAWGHWHEGEYTFAVDTQGHAVRRWTGVSWETAAGGVGAGDSASQLHSPGGIWFVPGSAGSPGQLYVADTFNHRIMLWQEGTGSGQAIAGMSGQAGSGLDMLRYPTGVHANGTHLHIVDYGNLRVLAWASGSSTGMELPLGEYADLPILPGIAAEAFLDDSGGYYAFDRGAATVQACSQQTSCNFTECVEYGGPATYNAACGCFNSPACSSAYGVMPGSKQTATVVQTSRLS